MTLKRKLRLVSLALFLIAIIFVLCALSAPNLGSVFYLSSFPIGVEVWRVFYVLYFITMAGLFVASFLIQSNHSENRPGTVKRILSWLPALLALSFYGTLGLWGGFRAIHPGVWICIALLLTAAVLLSGMRWWGCLFGVAVGGVLIWMGSRYTGQILSEGTLGAALCLYYALLGLSIRCPAKHKEESV